MPKAQIIIAFSWIFLSAQALWSQPAYSFHGSRAAHILTATGDSLVNAFAGGLNNPQMYHLDVAGSSQEELVIFDREGSRWMVFEWHQNEWVFRPRWARFFPKVYDWVDFKDYNCDGVMDLFCSKLPGIGVYQGHKFNDSMYFSWALPGNVLMTDYLNGSNPTNIYCTSVDRPVIEDVDGDGDIDVLAFGMLGATLEFHQNDSACGLSFTTSEDCWGDFAESGITNTLVLDACDGFLTDPNPSQTPESGMHSGSTALLHDFDGNGTLDIMLGDVSFSNAVVGYNTGTPAPANIESQDTLWPSNGISMNLPMFPGFSLVDANQDGLLDVIGAPNMPAGIKDTCVWAYHNTGSVTSPVWSLADSSFMQHDMVELGGHVVPYLADFNMDALPDLIVGSRNGLQYYQNVGSASFPRWQLTVIPMSNSAANSVDWCSPTAADFNGDNLTDILVGQADGTLTLLLNNGTFFNPSFTGTVTQNYGSIDVGQYASPEWVDIDGDNDLDLLVGNGRGYVAYYDNSNGSYSLVSAQFGGIDAAPEGEFFGLAIPRMQDIGLGNTLFMGTSKRGVIQMGDLSTALSMPSTINHHMGTGDTSTTSLLETPFGSSKRTGRHQYLFRASELQQSGLTKAKITHLKLNVITSNAPYLSQGFQVKLGHTQDTASGQFGNNESVFSYYHVPSPGWNTITFSTPFIYDGSRNLNIEICFDKNLMSSDVHLVAHHTPFTSHVYGDVYNNNSVTSDGCAMPMLGSDSLRPDVQLVMVPLVEEVWTTFHDGNWNAPAIADMDGDNRLEMVMGVNTGGLRFAIGDTTSVGIDEDQLPTATGIGLKIWPNPGSQSFELVGTGDVVQVWDVRGRMIHEAPSQNMVLMRIDASLWKPGVYIVRQGQMTARWIKQ